MAVELIFVGLDAARGPDETAYCWLVDGVFVPVPSYLPVHWRDRIIPEWGPDRDGNMRWHFLWTGWNNGEGHAKVRKAGKTVYCHREVVETVEQRKLTRWNHVDHKCERKNCLNYDCLEAVTPGVNTQRGPGVQHQFKPAAAYQEQALSSATWREPLDGLDAQ